MADPAKAATASAPQIERLGPFAVSTSGAVVTAFAAETGWSPQEGAPASSVPSTFPMRWLSTPEIKSMLQARLQAAGAVAIHESQTFTYAQALGMDMDYVMQVSVEEQANPARLILRADVATPSGTLCLTMETILRMVSTMGTPA